MREREDEATRAVLDNLRLYAESAHHTESEIVFLREVVSTLETALAAAATDITAATDNASFAWAEVYDLKKQLAAAQKTSDPELLEAARSFLTAMTYERNEKEVALYKVVRARMDTTATEVV